jgi:anti-sigma regulatory factor (Ser/Thr protein kinase)
MRKPDLAPLTQWITAAALAHPHDLPAEVMRRLGLGRRAALACLNRLQGAHWLVREGSARQPRWRPGPLRQVVQTYTLAGMLEDEPWRRDFAPRFELAANVRRMARHAFTELLNNAIDHSEGEQVTVSMRQTPAQVQLLVSDDGCGLFERVQRSFAIADPALAMLELSKGRLTSLPERHCGRGLVTTSMLADVFDLRANAAAFQRRAWGTVQWHGMPVAATLAGRPGTSIYLAISLDTPRTLDEVLAASSVDAASQAFDRTRVPLHLLAAADDAALASRAEAKRVVARLSNFKRAEIDFNGITEIGHAFAHELFAVFPRLHPEVELVPVGAAPHIAAMIEALRA